MATVIRRHWVADTSTGLARRDRRSCEYECYIPGSLTGRDIVLSSEAAADMADPERAIAVQDAGASTLLDTEGLARILLSAESVGSSRIEGLEVGARRLLRAEAAMALGEEPSDITAAEVLANINARIPRTRDRVELLPGSDAELLHLPDPVGVCRNRGRSGRLCVTR